MAGRPALRESETALGTCEAQLRQLQTGRLAAMTGVAFVIFASLRRSAGRAPRATCPAGWWPVRLLATFVSSR
jgi:hypothetical protein